MPVFVVKAAHLGHHGVLRGEPQPLLSGTMGERVVPGCHIGQSCNQVVVGLSGVHLHRQPGLYGGVAITSHFAIQNGKPGPQWGKLPQASQVGFEQFHRFV